MDGRFVLMVRATPLCCVRVDSSPMCLDYYIRTRPTNVHRIVDYAMPQHGEESRRIFDSSACVVALRSVMRITYLAWRFSRATLYFEREFGGVWNGARDL